MLVVREGWRSWRYVRLWGFFDGRALAFDAEELVPHPGEALTVVLGAPHPDLSRCDSEYAADYDNLVLTAASSRSR